MKVIMLLLSISLSTCCLANDPPLATVRSLLKKAAGNKDSCNHLLTLLQPYTVNNNPLLFGYRAVASMAQAKHVFSPFSKMSSFKKGKAMLDSAIAYDKNNIELRMLRLKAQQHAPSFLHYNETLEEDKAFLTKALPGISDSYLKTEVTTGLQYRKKE